MAVEDVIVAKLLEDRALPDFEENKLFTDEIVEEIENIHGLKVEKIYKNILVKLNIENVKPIEFDVLMIARTPTGQKRLISIELKETDVMKVMSQAYIRSDFVDYSYVVMNTTFSSLVGYLVFYEDRDWLRETGVGFFTQGKLILPAKYKKRKIEIEMKKDE